MKLKFNIITRIIDMEVPSKNRKSEKQIIVGINEPFEKDKDKYIFKILSAKENEVVLEYDRGYAVRNEHKAYVYNTTLTIDEPKEISSMWGKTQTTHKITYLGIDISDDPNQIINEAISEDKDIRKIDKF